MYGKKCKICDTIFCSGNNSYKPKYYCVLYYILLASVCKYTVYLQLNDCTRTSGYIRTALTDMLRAQVTVV